MCLRLDTAKALIATANSAEEKLVIFFLIFPRKQDLRFYADCLQLHEISNPVFLGGGWGGEGVGEEEKYFKILSAENFTQSAKRSYLLV